MVKLWKQLYPWSNITDIENILKIQKHAYKLELIRN